MMRVLRDTIIGISAQTKLPGFLLDIRMPALVCLRRSWQKSFSKLRGTSLAAMKQIHEAVNVAMIVGETMDAVEIGQVFPSLSFEPYLFRIRDEMKRLFP